MQLFDQLDKDKSGTLELNELKKKYEDLCQYLTMNKNNGNYNEIMNKLSELNQGQFQMNSAIDEILKKKDDEIDHLKDEMNLDQIVDID